MISRLLLPSAVRLATYSCVRESRRIRARQIMYSARLASRLPPRLRRCLTTLPEEASMGATPHRFAKEASLFNLRGLSPATINSVAALSVPMPAKVTSSGPLAQPAARGAPLALRSPQRGPRNGGPPNAARTWSQTVRQRDPLRGGSAATLTSSLVESPRKRRRSRSGAVTRKACSWLAACVLDLIAERRAARRALIISTRPSPLLGTPEASPAKTARAARSASEGSDFFWRLRRELGRRCFGRSTSSTSIPLALKWRASPAP